LLHPTWKIIIKVSSKVRDIYYEAITTITFTI